MLTYPAGSLNVLYILSLADLNEGILYDTSQMNIDFGIGSNKLLTRPIYLWDLYSLALSTYEQFNDNNSFGVSDLNPYWYSIWAKSFNDDSGSSFFRPLETDYSITSFNHPVLSQSKYSGSFTYFPLISEVDSDYTIPMPETILGELNVLKAAIFPAVPLLITSSVVNHTHYGPIFIKSFNISASGKSNLSPVNVSVNFEGAKFFECPTVNPVTQNTFAFPEITYDTNSNPLYASYRTATVQDCLFADKAISNRQELQKYVNQKFNNESQTPTWQIVDMNLSITQDIKFQPIQMQPYGLSDENGPRYASLNSRNVTGYITFYSTQRNINFFTPGKGITLYFGSYYLFPMDNIDWQLPEGSVEAGSGFLTTYKFIARAANNSVAMNNRNAPSSEFSYISDLMYQNFAAGI